ncbi:hypothetical protein NECAME_17870 [Necator americanus]|uniref:Uncharacterized protein n=1 Tax=Necator americanus TaxID=51031 RepID=W2TKP3_NECAM|nr:hypothetical protein NECAME_17870 [Necator americanus]ETN81587.1 hypothetical protein NECAME_17870 [Necator americanus]
MMQHIFRSEGYMCLMRKLPKEHFRSALQRLLDGDFSWLYRQRLRIVLSSDAPNGVGDSVDLHDRQLNKEPYTSRWMDVSSTPGASTQRTPQQRSPRSTDASPFSSTAKKKRTRSSSEKVKMQLPVLALNEVFIGESLSSRVSYYEIQIDNSKMVKQKSSGIAICTGLPLSPLQGLASSDVSSWFLAARAANAGVSAQEFQEIGAS